MDDDFNNDIDNYEYEREMMLQKEKIFSYYNPMLINACRDGNISKFNEAVENGANINLKDDNNGWTPLIWACCNGSIIIVRELINLGAASSYYDYEYDFLKEYDNNKDNKLGVFNNNPILSPLQYAVLKGHYKICNLLLNHKLEWNIYDKYFNNVLHLACSSNSFDTVVEILQRGVVIYIKNCRGHFPVDLTTNNYIKELFNKHSEIVPYNPGTKEKILKLCKICHNFFDPNDCIEVFIYDTETSSKKEFYQNRCTTCNNIILKNEKEIEELITSYEITNLKAKLDYISENNIKIDLKILKKLRYTISKLELELELLSIISSLEDIPNYKIIKKRISIIKDLIKLNLEKNIVISDDLNKKVQVTIARLKAERNLRHFITVTDIRICKDDDLSKLQELIEKAEQTEVDNKYITTAKSYEDILNKNLNFKKIFDNYRLYPKRNFPLFEPIWDKRNKRWMDPNTNKPLDPKKPVILKLEKPKKKKKKNKDDIEIPSWAENRPEFEQTINKMESLINDPVVEMTETERSELLEMHKTMKTENKYRIRIEKDLAIIDEAFSQKKKK